MKKVKVFLTNLSYLNHNYGAQGIAFPFIDKLNQYFDADYTFALPKMSQSEKEFLASNGFYGVDMPSSSLIVAKCNQFFNILYSVIYLFKKKKLPNTKIQKNYLEFLKVVKTQDVFIDLSGIEFIGNVSFKRKYLNYLSEISMQLLAEKYNKLYLKYTKSYGPFPGKTYKFFVKRSFKKLPFLLVRGEKNLKQIRKLNLQIPLYSFPDISLSLQPESQEWALNYISNLGINPQKKIVGLSLSAVIASMKTNNSSCGDNHLKLGEEIVNLYKENYDQIILLPHSIGDGKDINSCDLALLRNFYNKLQNKENIFLIDDTNLTYKQTRAIIGLMDFYITGRYHSVASALFMAVPVISLSWHIKYRDIMSLFLDELPIIDCRKASIQDAMFLIKKYYYDRSWFDKEKVLEKKEKINQEIKESIKLVVDEIQKFVLNKK